MKHLLPFLFFLIACKTKNERHPGFEFKPPKIVEAKEVHPANIIPPVVVRATPPSKTLLGKPEIVELHSNVFHAKPTAVIAAGMPEVVFPAGIAYKPPHVVAALDSPYAAAPPDMIAIQAPHLAEKGQPGEFSTIKARDGLNSEEISSLMQDRDGNLWITEWWGGGISRYDGRFLWNYTMRHGLSSEVINCIYEDRQRNIWTGSYDNGINKFDGKYFTHYSVKEGLEDHHVNAILQDKTGAMWFGTNKALTKFQNGQFTHYTIEQGLPSNIIRSLMEDSQGNLWAGADGGLTKFDGHSFRNYTLALKFDEQTEISCIMEDRKGSIWFATNNGLFKYEGDVIKKFTTNGGLSSNNITNIIQETNGDIWIATRGGGVNKYDGKSFTHLGTEHGLPNDRVTSILEDKWGNIWLGTTGGVSRYEGKMFSHVMPVKEEEIEAVLADSKGNVWMGSGSGNCLNRYFKNKMMRYSKESGLNNTEYNYIYEDKNGYIWLPTWDGVDMYDGTFLNHYSKRNGLMDSVVFCMTQDKHGNYWFGTNKGVSKFDGKTFTNYNRAQGLAGNIIFSILEDHSGNMWFGTNENGICKFDGKTFTHFPGALSHPMVVGMTEDRNNNLWFCTAYGVNKFDGKRFSWYTTEHGLTNNITKDVLEDMNGNIWVGTINGLNKYIVSGKSLHNSIDELSYFKHYTISDGFSGAGTYENCMSIDAHGTIWIGSNDRLTKYYPEGDVRDTIAPVLKLIDVSLFGEKIKKQPGKVEFAGLSPWYNQPENLELAYNENYISFQFIGITTNRPQEVSYRYILEGLDNNWTTTSEPLAVYNSLPHGNYKFRVKSVNGEGYWSNELSYAFVILPPWWQTTFAYIAYAIALCALIWTFTWYRSRRLKAENILLEEKVTRRTDELKESIEERYRLSEQLKSQQALLNERLRISRDLHDEIGSTLGSISIYSEVAKKRSEKNENPVTVLSKIGTASRELIDKMSDIVWSLNLNHENFEQMLHRMRAFATMLFTPRNIRYEFHIQENAKHVQLSNAQTKNIFLIYKEAVYNIVKYADCCNVLVRFSVNDNELMMLIKDDGKGFSTMETTQSDELIGGNGIKNMYVRSEEIEGRVIVDSQVNLGTTITVIVPL